jgi:lipoate-protein ligase B
LGTRCTLLRPGSTPYTEAWTLQQRLAADVRDGGTPTLILLEHPPTYTLGVRGRPEHVLATPEALAARGATLERTDRGGDVTFHGPGQLVGYPIVDLCSFGQGPVTYVRALESLLIEAVAAFGIIGTRFPKRPGVWVGEAKVAAIGVRISRGITTHGFALNVNTDLSYFDAIVACGYRDTGVTSMQRLTGAPVEMRQVEDEVAQAFARTFDVELGEPALAGVLDGG